MKITKFFALLCAIAIGFVACETNEPSNEPNNNQPGGGNGTTSGDLVLTADKTVIELGETVTFTVEQKDETTGEMVDVTAQEDIKFYDVELNKLNNPFTPTVSGAINVTATKGKFTSNTVTITVMAQMPAIPTDPQPENLAFNHRAVLIDHTGVNCPACPNATNNLMQLATTQWHSYYNEVTCHAGSYANGDPAASAAATALNQMQNSLISGYPTICINFYNRCADYGYTTISSVLSNIIKKDGADAGISMAVEGDSTNIYCAAQVKAKESKEYKVVAWLLENNIYSPNQKGATKDYHKIYNYALRNISGEYSRNNVSGESIGVLEAGKTHDCAFTLPIVSTKWTWENMGVLVIVSAKDSNNRWEVVNSAYCSLEDKSKAYEYVE